MEKTRIPTEGRDGEILFVRNPLLSLPMRLRSPLSMFQSFYVKGAYRLGGRDRPSYNTMSPTTRLNTRSTERCPYHSVETNIVSLDATTNSGHLAQLLQLGTIHLD